MIQSLCFECGVILGSASSLEHNNNNIWWFTIGWIRKESWQWQPINEQCQGKTVYFQINKYDKRLPLTNLWSMGSWTPNITFTLPSHLMNDDDDDDSMSGEIVVCDA